MLRLAAGMGLALAAGCGLVDYDITALSGDGDAGPVDGDGTPIEIDGAIDGSMPTGDCAGVVTGSYVGDGSAGRSFGVGFQPVMVIIQSENAQPAMVHMASMPPDVSKQAVGAVPAETGVLIEAPDGFAVGADVRVNELGAIFHYAAFPASANIATGQYDGNGATQSITGVGFQPDWLLVTDRDDGVMVTRFDNLSDRTFRLEGNNGVTDGVTSFDADGFSLGNRPFSNRDGRTFDYVAWQNEPGRILANSYLGNGTVDRLIVHGFRPEYVLLRSENDGAAIHRFESLAGDFSLPIGPEAPVTDAIKSLEDTGFQISSNLRTNQNAVEFSFLALAVCTSP